MKCYFDSANSYLYGSFYLYGLYKMIGKENVIINHSKFKSLPDSDRNVRFIIIKDNAEYKYFIQANDTFHINKTMYEWCDVYGCVNTNFKYYPKRQYPKLISIAPSFGIRVHNSVDATLYALKTLRSSFSTIIKRVEWNKFKNCEEVNPCLNIKHHIGRILKSLHSRLPYEDYQKPIMGGVKNNYIFFQSTLWYNNDINNNDSEVNLRRANFIRAAKQFRDVEFDGGLLADNSSTKGLFDDVVIYTPIPMSEWIEKSKKSVLVFNTPAFWNCHGWKLGEYLALGKCIVSTKLFNDLPAPLVHGKHIHYVDNSIESMVTAIRYIIEHPEYRQHLENGAKEWWSKYGTPEASLRLLGITKN